MKNNRKIIIICLFLMVVLISRVYAYWTDILNSEINITITMDGYFEVLDIPLAEDKEEIKEEEISNEEVEAGEKEVLDSETNNENEGDGGEDGD